MTQHCNSSDYTWGILSWLVQQTIAIAATTIAETTIEDKLPEKMTFLEEIELSLITGFEETTALEDKKSLTVVSAIAVVCCRVTFFIPNS